MDRERTPEVVTSSIWNGTVQKTVTICFQVSPRINDSLLMESQRRGVEVDTLLNDLLEEHLPSSDHPNRRAYDRTSVELCAVARPMGDVKGIVFLSGKVLDLSAGGLKLRCEGDERVQSLIGVGGQVEIIFSVPDSEYPVCFTCEVKHVYNALTPEFGCQFMKSSGNSLDVLKDLLN